MLCVLLFALGVPLSAAEPTALEVASFTVAPDAGTRRMPAIVVLQNNGPRNVRLWAPNNVEGLQALSFELKDASGRVRPYHPPVPPRAAGVPTAVKLAPGQQLRLQAVDLAAARETLDLPSGRYTVIAVYKNLLSELPPVRGVWTGTLRSKPVKLEL